MYVDPTGHYTDYSNPANEPVITDGPDVFDEHDSSSESDDEQEMTESEGPEYEWNEERGEWGIASYFVYADKHTSRLGTYFPGNIDMPRPEQGGNTGDVGNVDIAANPEGVNGNNGLGDDLPGNGEAAGVGDGGGNGGGDEDEDEDGGGKSFNEIFSDSVYKHSWENKTSADGKISFCNKIVCGVVGDCGFDTTPFENVGVDKMIDNLNNLAKKQGGGVGRCTSFKEAQDKADRNIGNYLVIILYIETKHHVAFVRNRYYSGNGKYGTEIGMRSWKNANLAIAGGGLKVKQMKAGGIFSDDIYHFDRWPFSDYHIFIYSRR
jgi:hypothetical protein